ncbi:hypothetical protein [Nitrosomonas eutropha]|uniref:hypothetical protein n=1 Tax=Nitrosomonas eutropha TaxID=916 RepID=UPI0002FE3B1D|nr:hypothetical protein [Nitrosomonas eutropha]
MFVGETLLISGFKPAGAAFNGTVSLNVGCKTLIGCLTDSLPVGYSSFGAEVQPAAKRKKRATCKIFIAKIPFKYAKQE